MVGERIRRWEADVSGCAGGEGVVSCRVVSCRVVSCCVVSLLHFVRNFRVSVCRFALRRNFDAAVVVAFNFCVGETNLFSFVVLYVGWHGTVVVLLLYFNALEHCLQHPV